MSASRAPKRTSSSKPKTNASEIAPGLFVGGWSDAESFTGTKFCVLDEAPPDMPPATHVPIYDDGNHQPIVANLDRLAKLIGAARAKDEPVLVFCGHGVRRSPLAGAWYLHRADGLTLDESFDRVRAVRPKIEHVKKWAKGWKVLDESGMSSGRSS
ncbi:MAG: dual specificity protein phosphatase family protein [Thermoplasmata archaeon]